LGAEICMTGLPFLQLLELRLVTKSIFFGILDCNIFDAHEEKLFSAMCKWSNHCLHHLLPSERDTGHA